MDRKEIGEYISEDCVHKNGEELILIGIEGMRSHLIAVKNTYPDYFYEDHRAVL